MSPKRKAGRKPLVSRTQSSRGPARPARSAASVRAEAAGSPYTEQEYMQDMMTLRRELESRLEELDAQRQERLNQIPAAAEAQARLHGKIQDAEVARARVRDDVERSLREALSRAEMERTQDFSEADNGFRDKKTALERQLDDDSRKARERLEAAIREIEARFPVLADRTLPKLKAHEQYERELKAAKDEYNREWDRRREDYQTARQDGLTRERLAGEAAAAKADFARSEADRAYEQTVVAAKAIFRVEVAAAGGDVQAEFDDRRQQLLKDWEGRKDALSERYRRERRR